ncbi:MAG: hypothetical protein ACC655_03890 [Rhodothermia bacterium]
MSIIREIVFFPGRRIQNRRFSYEPRYYDPTHDENIRQRLRIKSGTYSGRRSPMRLLIILGLLIIAVYLFLSL